MMNCMNNTLICSHYTLCKPFPLSHVKLRSIEECHYISTHLDERIVRFNETSVKELMHIDVLKDDTW